MTRQLRMKVNVKIFENVMRIIDERGESVGFDRVLFRHRERQRRRFRKDGLRWCRFLDSVTVVTRRRHKVLEAKTKHNLHDIIEHETVVQHVISNHYVFTLTGGL